MILNPRQRPTVTANADYAFSARKTTARQLLSECAALPRYVHKPGLRSGSGWLFFKCAHDRVHVNFQHTSRIPNTTSIQGHFNDFLFDTRFMCFVSVGQLEATFTGFTFVALITVRTEPFTPDSLLVATVAARNDESYHAVKTKSPRLCHDHYFKQCPESLYIGKLDKV